MTRGGTRLAPLLVPCGHGYMTMDGLLTPLGFGNMGTLRFLCPLRMRSKLLVINLGMDSNSFVGTNLCTHLDTKLETCIMQCSKNCLF